MNEHCELVVLDGVEGTEQVPSAVAVDEGADGHASS